MNKLPLFLFVSRLLVSRSAVAVSLSLCWVGCSSAGSQSGGGGQPLVLIAGAPAAELTQRTLGFSYDVSSDTWSAPTVLGSATSGGIDGQNGSIAVALSSASDAIAVLTGATDPSGVSGPVQYAKWTSGNWTPFASIDSSITAASAPSLTLGGQTPEVAFASDAAQDESVVSLSQGAWSAATKIAGHTGGPPSIATFTTGVTVAYVRSSDGALVAVDEANGSWGSEQVIEPGDAPAAPSAAIAPTLVALSGSGPELVVVYTDGNLADLHSATRKGGTWSSIEDFNLLTKVINSDNGGTDQPNQGHATPALPLPGGDAILAFTSSGQYVYTSKFDGSSWSTATSVFKPWCLDCIDVAQAGLALGVGSATTEIVFGGDPSSQNLYVPYHTRLIGNQWTTPKPVVSQTPGLFTTFALASVGGNQ